MTTPSKSTPPSGQNPDQGVAAVVLAAGRSRRMEGRNKLLLDLDGKAMVRGIVETVLAAGVAPVVVVTGFEADRVAAVLAGLDVFFVHNPDFEDGMASSLRAGVAALPATCAGVLVVLGDMPDVRADDIRRLAAAFAEDPGRICLPVHDGRRGNPVVLPKWLFADIATIRGDKGARALIASHPDRVCEVAVASPGVLTDLDTPADLPG